MFALLAVICFGVRLFGGHIGDIDLVVLGLAFVALQLLWDAGIPIPWRRRQPPAT